MFLRIIILAFCTVGSLPALCGAVLPRYLMSTFRLSGDNQLLIATSPDGANWNSSGNLYTDSRGLRDPSIVYLGGYYYAAYTILAFSPPTSNALVGIARSADLLQWTHYTDVSFAAAGTVQVVWAPEWFVDTDGSVHLLASPAISMITGSHSFGHDLYEVHPTSDDLLSWSAAAHLTGLPVPTGTPNDGNIDPFLVKKDGFYYLFFIWENFTWPLCLYRSENLLGPYSPAKPLNTNWAGIGSRKEGESVAQMSDGSWRIYYSINTGAEQLAWVESRDDWATWSTSVFLSCAEFLNHGTMSSPGEDTADADGNGVPNLLQYALSGNGGFDLEMLPLAKRNPNGRLTLSFLRARSDVTYVVEASSNLAAWETLATNPGTVGKPVMVVDPASLTAPQRMLRLRVLDP